jgi:23S rRNA (uracil1939-C5)-methyltransferase
MIQCTHFPVCGGCTSLNSPYDQQLLMKRAYLLELFKPFKITIPQIIASPVPWYYRHKVQLPFEFDKKNRGVILGCFASDTHTVIDQKECHIQDKDLSGVVRAVRLWANKTRLTVYNESSGSGFLRYVLLRKGAGTGEILVGFVTNGERPESSRFLSNKLLEYIASEISDIRKVVGIVQNVNTRKTNVVLGQKEYTWWGRPFIKENLGFYKFKIGLSTFFQVNPPQASNIYDEVKSFIPEQSRVLDLYSGTGSISIWISSRAKEVVGIEENLASVSAARDAVTLNKLRNIRFIAGDTTEHLPDLANKGYSVAVVDPPRKGLDKKVINTILSSSLERLIYVSCNPETLVRDIDFLKPAFRILSMKGFDMFPHTEHIECVAVLEKIK